MTCQPNLICPPQKQKLKQIQRQAATVARSSLPGLIAALLLGCASAPVDQPTPVLPRVEANFRYGGNQPTTPFDAGWWTAFADPALASLITRALAANHDVLIAAERVRQARAGSAAAASRLRPTVALTASASDQRTTLGDEFKRGITDTRVYRAALDLGWEIDAFGAARASASAAELDALAAKAGVQAARLGVASEVARQYTLNASARLRLAKLRSLLAAQNASEALTRRQQVEGLASQLDVARVAGETQSLAALLPPLETLAAVTESKIAVLLGTSPSTPLPELRAARSVALPTAPPMALGQPADLLLRRPDLQAAQMQWLAEGARLRESQADLWPKLFVSGVLGGEDLTINLLNTGPARYTNLALAFSMPLLNAGRLKANVERLSARERAATLQFEQATLKALQDVENSLMALDKERDRNRLLEAATGERRTAVRLAQSLAREGQVNQLRVLEAQRGEIAAELSALESQTELVLGAIQLFKAMGGGWQLATGQSRATPLAAIFSSATTSNSP